MTDQMDEFSVWWYGDHSEELQSRNSAWHGWYAKESTHAAEVEKLREEIARLTYVEEAYKAECTDFDRVLAKIGVTAEDARTEGGVLQVARICNHLQETYDALCLSQEFGADMVSKYSASSKQLSAAQSLLAMQHEALKEVNNHPISFSSKTVLAALSATAETVSKWEAKKLEPLEKKLAVSQANVEFLATGVDDFWLSEHGHLFDDNGVFIGGTEELTKREASARKAGFEEGKESEWFAVKTLKNKLEMQYAVFAGDCIIAKEEGFQAGKQAAQDLLKDKP